MAAQAADSLKITVNGAVVVNFNAPGETGEFFSALQVAPFPDGFIAGTLYLIEPQAEWGTGSEITSLGGVDLTGKHVSDALSFNGSQQTGKFNVFFISDGATAAQLKDFPIFATTNSIDETGKPQDVSAFFGFPKGAIIVLSDVGGGVPEPAAWALMILGFGAAGAALRRDRRAIA